MNVEQQCTRPMRRRAGLRAVAVTVLLSVGAASAGVASAAGDSRTDARDAATAAFVRQPLATTTPVDVTGDDVATLMKLIDALEEDDDVQTVSGNYEISDEELEKLA